MDWDLIVKFGTPLLGVAAICTVIANVWTNVWTQRRQRQEKLDEQRFRREEKLDEQRFRREEKLDEQRFRREEKLDEQRALRGDSHRSDLRHAYSEFIGSYSELLAIAAHYSELFDDLEDGSPSNARQPEVEAQSNLLKKARIDTQITLAELLLLEDDATAVDRLIPFLESPLRWPDDNNYEMHLQTHREQRGALLRVLAGAFSPARWEERARRIDVSPTANDHRLLGDNA